MKSLRTRLTLWFGIWFIIIASAFTVLINHRLETTLLQKACNKAYADLPDWNIRNTMTEAEVDTIAKELTKSALIWALPVVVLAIAGGYWLARQSLQPIARVNRQLAAKNPGNLAEPIQLPEADSEFRDLLRQLNDLLARLNASFGEMNNYAAKVAHELRTPLSIMRLKVEQAGERIAPELADELENELHRLTHVVDQSLLIARAEQGRLVPQRSVFNLTTAVTEVVGDFQLLAAEQNRRFTLKADEDCWVAADPRHLRQIIHTLLTNALKHGGGDLSVRLTKHSRHTVLLVANRVNRAPDRETTLGLGLRVVAALLRLEPEVQLQRRHGKNHYATRLRLPTVEQSLGFHI
ncbi:MAG TPA: histidine kinase dimerization/phospho-acceptor domain-containing protein [Verrucomicrobiae bacterium]